MLDLIDREVAMDAVMEWLKKAQKPLNRSKYNEGEIDAYSTILTELKNIPPYKMININYSAVKHQTIYGYSIQHLILIANILQEENLPPERVVEALTDIGKIVNIITNEFEDSLRRSVNRCFCEYRFRMQDVLR